MQRTGFELARAADRAGLVTEAWQRVLLVAASCCPCWRRSPSSPPSPAGHGGSGPPRARPRPSVQPRQSSSSGTPGDSSSAQGGHGSRGDRCRPVRPATLELDSEASGDRATVFVREAEFSASAGDGGDMSYADGSIDMALPGAQRQRFCEGDDPAALLGGSMFGMFDGIFDRDRAAGALVRGRAAARGGRHGAGRRPLVRQPHTDRARQPGRTDRSPARPSGASSPIGGGPARPGDHGPGVLIRIVMHPFV